MADYKKMYLTLMNATEEAIRTLVEAQRTCEELFVESEEDEEFAARQNDIKLVEKTEN